MVVDIGHIERCSVAIEGQTSGIIELTRVGSKASELTDEGTRARKNLDAVVSAIGDTHVARREDTTPRAPMPCSRRGLPCVPSCIALAKRGNEG